MTDSGAVPHMVKSSSSRHCDLTTHSWHTDKVLLPPSPRPPPPSPQLPDNDHDPRQAGALPGLDSPACAPVAADMATYDRKLYMELEMEQMALVDLLSGDCIFNCTGRFNLGNCISGEHRTNPASRCCIQQLLIMSGNRTSSMERPTTNMETFIKTGTFCSTDEQKCQPQKCQPR